VLLLFFSCSNRNNDINDSIFYHEKEVARKAHDKITSIYLENRENAEFKFKNISKLVLEESYVVSVYGHYQLIDDEDTKIFRERLWQGDQENELILISIKNSSETLGFWEVWPNVRKCNAVE